MEADLNQSVEEMALVTGIAIGTRQYLEKTVLVAIGHTRLPPAAIHIASKELVFLHVLPPPSLDSCLCLENLASHLACTQHRPRIYSEDAKLKEMGRHSS